MKGDDLTDEQLNALSPAEKHYIKHLRAVKRYQQKNREKMNQKLREYYQRMREENPEKYRAFVNKQNEYEHKKRKEKNTTIATIEEIPNNEEFNKKIDIDNLSMAGDDLTDYEFSDSEI